MLFFIYNCGRSDRDNPHYPKSYKFLSFPEFFILTNPAPPGKYTPQFPQRQDLVRRPGVDGGLGHFRRLGRIGLLGDCPAPVLFDAHHALRPVPGDAELLFILHHRQQEPHGRPLRSRGGDLDLAPVIFDDTVADGEPQTLPLAHGLSRVLRNHGRLRLHGPPQGDQKEDQRENPCRSRGKQFYGSSSFSSLRKWGQIYGSSGSCLLLI